MLKSKLEEWKDLAIQSLTQRSDSLFERIEQWTADEGTYSLLSGAQAELADFIEVITSLGLESKFPRVFEYQQQLQGKALAMFEGRSILSILDGGRGYRAELHGR